MDDILQKTATTTCCSVAIIIKNGCMLRGLRLYTDELHLWTAPGGRCDAGETIEAGLRREVEEEVGITDLQIKEYLGSACGYDSCDTLHIFICDSDQQPRNMEPEKFAEWKWVPLNEYIAQGQQTGTEESFLILKQYLTEKHLLTL